MNENRLTFLGSFLSRFVGSADLLSIRVERQKFSPFCRDKLHQFSHRYFWIFLAQQRPHIICEQLVAGPHAEVVVRIIDGYVVQIMLCTYFFWCHKMIRLHLMQTKNSTTCSIRQHCMIPVHNATQRFII